MEKCSRSAFCRIKAVSNAIRRKIEGINIEEKYGLTGGECAIMGYLFENMERPLYQRMWRRNSTSAEAAPQGHCRPWRKRGSYSGRANPMTAG